MSARNSTPAFLGDEREDGSSRAAGHVERGGYMAGGRLFLTNRRLIWVPSGFARRVSASGEVDLNLSEISTVEILPRPIWPLIGGMRRRIRVVMRDGTEHLFMITTGGIADYASQLQAVVAQAAAAADSPEAGIS